MSFSTPTKSAYMAHLFPSGALDRDASSHVPRPSPHSGLLATHELHEDDFSSSGCDTDDSDPAGMTLSPQVSTLPRTPSAPPSSHPGAAPGPNGGPYASPSMTGTGPGGSPASSHKPLKSGNPSPTPPTASPFAAELGSNLLPPTASPFAAELGSNPLGRTRPAKPNVPQLHMVADPHTVTHTPGDGRFGGGQLLAWPGTYDPSSEADAGAESAAAERMAMRLGDGGPSRGTSGREAEPSAGEREDTTLSDADDGHWLPDTLPFISPGVSSDLPHEVFSGGGASEFPHDAFNGAGRSLLSTGVDIAPSASAACAGGGPLPGRAPLRIFETPSLLDTDPAPPEGGNGSREGTPMAGETWSLRRAPSNSLLTAQSFPNGCLEGSPPAGGAGPGREAETANLEGRALRPASPPELPASARTHPGGGTVVAHVTVSSNTRAGSAQEGTTSRQSAGGEGNSTARSGTLSGPAGATARTHASPEDVGNTHLPVPGRRRGGGRGSLAGAGGADGLDHEGDSRIAAPSDDTAQEAEPLEPPRELEPPGDKLWPLIEIRRPDVSTTQSSSGAGPGGQGHASGAMGAGVRGEQGAEQVWVPVAAVRRSAVAGGARRRAPAAAEPRWAEAVAEVRLPVVASAAATLDRFDSLSSLDPRKDKRMDPTERTKQWLDRMELPQEYNAGDYADLQPSEATPGLGQGLGLPQPVHPATPPAPSPDPPRRSTFSRIFSCFAG